MTVTYFKREVSLHDLSNCGLNEEVQRSIDMFDSHFSYKNENSIYDDCDQKTAEIDGSYFRIYFTWDKLFRFLLDMDIVGDGVGSGDVIKFLSERKFDIEIENTLLYRHSE